MSSTSPVDYTSTAEVAVYMSQIGSDPSTVAATFLALLITRESRHIDDFCGRRFYTTTGPETVYFDGNGRSIFIPPLDILSCSGLRLAVDTHDASSGTYTTISTGDFYLRPSYPLNDGPYTWIELSDDPQASYSTSQAFTSFPVGYNTIRLNGYFGYANTTAYTGVPAVIRHCATELVIRALRGAKMTFNDNVGIEGLGVATFSRQMPSDIAAMLHDYKRVDVV